MIHVCSLAALPDTVKATGASHVLTVMANVDQVQRPESVLPANHLKVQMDDITEQIDGFVAPCDLHIEQVPELRARLGSWHAAGRALLCRHQPFDGKRVRRRVLAQSASGRNIDRPPDPCGLPDRVAEPVDRQPGRQGAWARRPHAASPRRNGSRKHDRRRPSVPHRSGLINSC